MTQKVYLKENTLNFFLKEEQILFLFLQQILEKYIPLEKEFI